jgi:hypothetical protein
MAKLLLKCNKKIWKLLMQNTLILIFFLNVCKVFVTLCRIKT